MVVQVHNPLAGKHGFERFQGWLEQLPHPIFIRSGLQQVTNADLASGSITGDKIQNATITGDMIESATITAINIALATILGANIALATITGTNIGSATITGTNIANATIAGTNLINATITGTQIANATITGGLIAAATITGGNIASATILGGNVAAGTITGGNIASTTITAGNITNLTITAAQIANLTITSGKVNTALMSYNHNIVFSSTSATQVNWATGTLTTSDGTSYSISAGNTGTMAAKTFIYLDTAVSVTVLQITTTLTTAVGDGRMLLAVAQNNTNESIFQVFNGIGGTNLAGASIVAASITSNEIAAATITAGNMVVGTITAASGIIADINADTITSGSIRAINVNAGSYTTKGSYLTSAPSGGATTLNVKNTADFPTSGSGQIIDTTNDRDAFSWTGKTSNTLTGCTGVLAHNNGATIIPLVQCMVIDAAVNEMRFFADNGASTIEEVASIGLQGPFGDLATLAIGSASSRQTAIVAYGNINLSGLAYFENHGSGPCVYAHNVGSVGGSGLVAQSATGVGADIGGSSAAGNLRLPNCNGTTFPTSAFIDYVAQVGDRLYYADGSHWLPLNQPYFESSEQALATSSNVSVSHSLTDGTGTNRVPHNWQVVIRCKTAELGYSVGDEVQVGFTQQVGGTAGIDGNSTWVNATTIGLSVGTRGITVTDKTSWVSTLITLANWKAVFYAS